MFLSLIHLASLLVDEYSFMNATWLEPLTRRCQNAQKQDLGKKKRGWFNVFLAPQKEAVRLQNQAFSTPFFYARHRPTAFIWSRNFSLDILCISQGRPVPWNSLDVDTISGRSSKNYSIPDGWFSKTFCHCKDDDLVPWRWSKKVIGNICQSFCNPGYNFSPTCQNEEISTLLRKKRCHEILIFKLRLWGLTSCFKYGLSDLVRESWGISGRFKHKSSVQNKPSKNSSL